MKLTPEQTLLMLHLKELGIDAVAEVRVCQERKWRFDIAEEGWPVWRRPLAFEIEGGQWVRGRHTRGSGFQSDLEKYREAVVRGWLLLRFSPQEVRDGTAKRFVAERVLRHSGESHEAKS